VFTTASEVEIGPFLFVLSIVLLPPLLSSVCLLSSLHLLSLLRECSFFVYNSDVCFYLQQFLSNTTISKRRNTMYVSISLSTLIFSYLTFRQYKFVCSLSSIQYRSVFCFSGFSPVQQFFSMHVFHSQCRLFQISDITTASVWISCLQPLFPLGLSPAQQIIIDVPCFDRSFFRI
jgi:hypothetical protein